jgi:aryl-phospho-beta-D-glucosidase BglC (GH1 family)
MASVGINTVRLPLGYWHIGTGGDRDWMQDTMYAAVQDQYEGAWPRVLQSISWAAKYGIGVLIDLHGAPGSQNGTSLFLLCNMFSDSSQVETTLACRMAKSTCSILPTICARRFRCSSS